MQKQLICKVSSSSLGVFCNSSSSSKATNHTTLEVFEKQNCHRMLLILVVFASQMQIVYYSDFHSHCEKQLLLCGSELSWSLMTDLCDFFFQIASNSWS